MKKLILVIFIVILYYEAFSQCPTVTLTPSHPTVCGGSGSTTLTANVSGGVAPYGFLWSTGETTQSINVTVGGVYKVSVSSGGCAPVVDSVTVVQATIPFAWNSGPVCSGQALNLLAANYDNATYSWTGPNGFTSTDANPVINNISVSQGGVYQVSVTVNGCTTSPASTTVVVNATPAIPVAANNGPLCAGATLNLTASTAAGATYNWIGITWNGFTSTLQNPVINNITAQDIGTYYVTASANGCTSAPGSTIVVVKPLPVIFAAGNNGPLCVGTTLNLTATSTPGVAFTWTGPNGFTSNNQYPVINNVNNINAGTYAVTAIENGCTGIAGLTNVIINSIPAPPAAGNNGPLCLGETLNLTASTVAGGTYNWTGPNGFTSTSQNPVISNITPLHAGKYYVTVTVNGCTSPMDSTTFVLKTSPGIPTVNNNGPLCIGATLNLTASTIAGATYIWTGPNGFTSTMQNPVINNISPANAGDYFASSILSGCPGLPGSTTLVVKPDPPTPTTGNNGPLCVGTTLLLTANTIAGATYTWTGPNGFTSTLQNPVLNNVNFIDAGTYNVSAIINGCTGSAGSTSVIVNLIPAAPVAGNNGPLCIGEILNLTANTIAGATYSWTGPNGFSSTNQNPVINNITPLHAGKYFVSVTINGCTGPPDSTTFILKTSPGTPTAGNNGPLCIGSTLNLTSSTVAGATYLWSGPNGFTSNLQNPVLNNITPLNAGDYYVSSIVNNCPSLPATTTLNVLSTPVTPTVGNNGPLCVGTTLNLTANTVAGAIYNWTGPNGFTSTLQNPVINNVLLTNTGVYSVSIIVNGCNSLAGVTNVIIYPIPAAPVVNNNGPLCVGTTLNLTANTIAGATYNWTGPNGFTSTTQNPVLNNIALADAGSFKATVSVNGCTSSSGNTLVIVNPIPVMPVAGNNGVLCVGVTLNLTVGNIPGATYNWTGPNGFTSSLQNPVINNVALTDSGIYSVTAVVNGCTSPAAPTNVLIKPLPIIPVVGSNSPICSGDALLLNTPFLAGISYSWTGPNGFTSSLQNPVINNAGITNGGIYTVTVTGCVSKVNTTTVMVTQTPSMPAPSNNGPLCVGTTLNLSTAAIPGAIYKWTGPNSFISNQQNPVINNINLTNAGLYDLTVIENGCISPPGNTIVNIAAPPIANAGADQIVCAENSFVNISGMVTGGSGTGIWSTNGTGTFSPGNTSLIATYSLTNADKVAGNITLILSSTNNGGCPVSVSSLLVTIPNVITVDAGVDQTICASDNKIALNGLVNGAPGGIWASSGNGFFSPGSTSLNADYVPSPSDKSNGRVTLTLTSTGNGNCLAVSDLKIITILPGPLVNAGPDRFTLENSSIILEPVTSGTNLAYLWTPNLYLSSDTAKNPVVNAVDDQVYTLTVTDVFGCFNKDQVFINVLKFPTIPNTFTPNNDGINDKWIILNLDDYPGCKVQVFNRYGQVVFQSSGYTNPWDGTMNGKPLPFGTYYYVIEPGSGQKSVAGYVTIIK